MIELTVFDVKKPSVSKECDIYHYFYLNYSFKFQPNVFNRWFIKVAATDIRYFARRKFSGKYFTRNVLAWYEK